MGLKEILSELKKPGKIGTIDKIKRKNEKHIGMLIIKTILSLAIITGLYYVILGNSFHIQKFLVFVAVMALYSAAGYYILPKPDYSNIGWFGGLFDNPFKISDDINRMFIFVMVLLMPGRLISTTVLSWIDLFK